MSMLEVSWINPSKGKEQDLVWLSSGKLATPELKKDLQVEAFGKKAYKTFAKDQLESDPPKVKFPEKMTKLKLKTFDDLSKKMKVQKGANKKLIIKADRALRWMMHCATLSSLYPGPLLPPMGRWRKQTKHHFLIDSTWRDSTAMRANYWRNGNGLKDKRRPETFAEVADSFMYMILNEGIDS